MDHQAVPKWGLLTDLKGQNGSMSSDNTPDPDLELRAQLAWFWEMDQRFDEWLREGDEANPQLM